MLDRSHARDVLLYISPAYLVSFMMIDLHTHTTLSDGVLIPYEMVKRAAAKGYEAIALTDHVDGSTVDFVVPRLVKAARDLKGRFGIEVIAGAEVTHVPASMVADIVRECRALGAWIVIVHGETLVEPVEPGTNRAAIEARVDILAHPGLISEEEVRMAKELGVVIEITARKGHSLSNGHVARLCERTGAEFVVNTDGHAPEDLITDDFARDVLLGAGLSDAHVAQAFGTSRRIMENALRRI